MVSRAVAAVGLGLFLLSISCRSKGQQSARPPAVDPTPTNQSPQTPPPTPAPPPDAGTPAPSGPGPGPWPIDAFKDYSAAYNLPPLVSVGVDDGYNLWLLDASNRLGVLRPGDTTATWSEGIGQAGLGYGGTSICGGANGQAYVGYWAPDPVQIYRDPPWSEDTGSPGDVDVVQLNPDKTISLTQHLNVYNSADHHYNDVQGMFLCTKVMRGASKGDVYFGSNHAVTRFRGLDYSDHRHPLWSQNGTLMIGYHHAVGIAPNGDVLIGNDWKIGILSPPQDLQGWIDYTRNPWKLDTFIPDINSPPDFQYWRGVAQTQDGTYYFASKDFGLWSLPGDFATAGQHFTKVPRLPSDSLGWLAGTDDGSLFISTADAGLWRMGADKTLHPMTEVPGTTVFQLVYDPTVSPSMLYVLTDAGLSVLRGY